MDAIIGDGCVNQEVFGSNSARGATVSQTKQPDFGLTATNSKELSKMTAERERQRVKSSFDSVTEIIEHNLLVYNRVTVRAEPRM